MDKRDWVIVITASLAIAAATTLMVALRRTPWGDHLDDVPDLISDCYARIRELDTDLQHLRPSAQPAAG